MATLTPPEVQPANPASKEKQIYTLIESLSEFLPIANDRNRLAYCLLTASDSILVTLKTNKLTVSGISEEDLAKKIEAGFPV
jgi:hypothetical protein